MDSTLESRNANLRRAVDHLSTLPSHTLLRSSFSAPRLMHILRCSPCHDHPLLLVFDEIQRTGINVITNSNLSDTQWIQASLPICDGSLGIRRAASLALSAFLASAAATAPLQHHILAPSTAQPDTAFEAARAAWSNIFNKPQPVNTASQRDWTQPAKRRTNNQFGARLPHFRTRLVSSQPQLPTVAIGFTRYQSRRAVTASTMRPSEWPSAFAWACLYAQHTVVHVVLK